MTIPAPPPRPPTAPSRYKLAIVTWAAAYPTITFLLAAFKPLGLMALPLPLRTLLLTAILVPTMAFVLVPGISRIMRGWLRRSQRSSTAGFGLTRHVPTPSNCVAPAEMAGGQAGGSLDPCSLQSSRKSRRVALHRRS